MQLTISLSESLSQQATEIARELSLTPNRLLTQAFEEYVQRRQNQRDQQRLDEVYADGPTEEERAYQRAAFESYCRLIAKEAQEDEW